MSCVCIKQKNTIFVLMQICALQHPSEQLCKGKETWDCNANGYRTDFQHSPAAAAGTRF